MLFLSESGTVVDASSVTVVAVVVTVVVAAVVVAAVVVALESREKKVGKGRRLSS